MTAPRHHTSQARCSYRRLKHLNPITLSISLAALDNEEIWIEEVADSQHKRMNAQSLVGENGNCKDDPEKSVRLPGSTAEFGL